MKWSAKHVVLILAATVAALALRLPRLEQRPMHTDEAVHAIKFGALLEDGYYRYDSYEYHGPTLNYLTLIPAWLSSAHKITDTGETTLRIVPVFFGLLLVVMLLWLKDGLGAAATITAALLTAVSPAMAYYSRYYIQEMPMVCFTFGAIACGYRYSLNQRAVWAVCAGIFLGLMHATKETSIIAYGAMLAALVLNFLLRKRQSRQVHNFRELFKPSHVIAALATALLVSALFYSSFFSNPRGLLDSLLAFKTYLSRAGHDDLHIHPWYFYVKMLLLSKYGAGPTWTEAFIVILAGMGFVAAMRRDSLPAAHSDLARFLAFYTLIMTIIYSFIPYKTPWNLLGFLHGMILLASIGAAVAIHAVTKRWARILIRSLMITGVSHLAWQAYLANFKYYEDSANPYVYAHTVSDIYKVVERVQEMASGHLDQYNMRIDVIFPENDYWPLPWYLRAFPNVGWWDKVDETTPAAPVILAAAVMESEMIRKLYELPPPGERSLYVPLFDSYTELRPKVEIRGYVKKDLWDRSRTQ